MKRYFLFALIALMTTGSCTDRDDDLDSVNIRIKNASDLVFDSVLVGELEEPYINLSPDSYSEYQIFETAYTDAFVQITSGEETYTLQPQDLAGETPLPFGFYTYELDVTGTGEVVLSFVID